MRFLNTLLIKSECNLISSKKLIRMASDIRAPTTKAGKPREKVALKPGFHLVDWHRLMQASNNMDTRNGGPPRRISMAELKEHRSEFDCWTAYNGKVYNITQYMHYHPGGVKQLMAGAGKDCTKQFDKFHSWVHIDNILAKCYIGPLADPGGQIAEDDEDDEDDEDKAEKSGMRKGGDSDDAAARVATSRAAEKKDWGAGGGGGGFKTPFGPSMSISAGASKIGGRDKEVAGLYDADVKARALAALALEDGDVADVPAAETRPQEVKSDVDTEVKAAVGVARISDEAFIAAREAEDAAAFQNAVEEWRRDKAQGGGEAKIVDAGGGFSTGASSLSGGTSASNAKDQ
jgi:cytochrome b involved in lipid metabolism